MAAREETLSETQISLRRDDDIVLACQTGRALAAQAGLSGNDQVVVVIAISEVACNIVKYAQQGEIILCLVRRQPDDQYGLVVVARDQGPGIPDVELAMRDGYSTGQGLGLGLSGAKRLMDEFEIVSQVGRGTTVTMRKWKR